MNYQPILDKLTELSQKDKEWKQQFSEKEKCESSQFNPFQFMRTDEDGLSYILRFLLDPAESHGQQLLFLNQFLFNLKLAPSLLEFDKDSDNISISIHQPTIKNRYHDIFIKTSNWVMSIESKLRNAVEQENQIYDYIEDMESKNNSNHFMIFLNTSENGPKTGGEKWEDLKENRKAKVITPEFLHTWLEDCEKECLSQKIKDFIGYFKSFLENLFGLKKSREIEESNVSLELEYDEFESIWLKFQKLDFLQKYRNEFNQLIREVKYVPEYYGKITEYCRNKLKEQLRDKLSSTNYELDENYSLNQSNTIYPIYFKPKSEFIPNDQNIPFWICYEDQGKGYWAVFWYTKEREKYPELAKLFSEIQVENGLCATPKYPIWTHCAQKELAFWNDEYWVKILDGSLIEDIWGNIQGLVENPDIIDRLKTA